MNVNAPLAAVSLPADVAERVLCIVMRLVHVMARFLVGHRHQAHRMAVWNSLVLGSRRFARVMERVAAGETFVVRASRAGVARKASARPRLRVPRGKAWMLSLGWQVSGCIEQLAHVLRRPDVPALVAATPQAQRVLRPMLHILGIEVPCVPPLPRRPRKPRPPRPTAEGSKRAGSEQVDPTKAGPAKPSRLTRKAREAVLWHPNLAGEPMDLLPRRLPRRLPGRLARD